MKATDINCPYCGCSAQPEMHLCRNCGAVIHTSYSNDLLRLNPFAFPPDTHFRLILLIISVLGASLFVYGNLYNETISGLDHFVPLHCALWMLGGSLLVMVIAGVIYWLKPECNIRRGDWQILQDEDVPAPGITAYLTNLCKEAGLEDHPPIFLWHPITDDGGQAFGRIGRVYVYLSGALVRAFKNESKRSEFRANVLHELAHICNSDVHRTSVTIAVWYAFAIAALPVFVVPLLNSPLERIVKMSWRSLLLVLLVYLIWCAILRVCELYADVQAYRLDGFSNTIRYLREEAARQRTIPSSKKDNVLLPAWLKTWKRRVPLYHPNAKEQIHILENPTTLMKMGFWDAFATGMATTTAFFNVAALVLMLVMSSQENFNQFLLSAKMPEALDKFGFLIFLVPAFILALVVIYIVGLGTWRIVLTEIVCGKQIHGLGKLALGLASGIVVGLQTSFLAASNFAPPIIVVFLIGLLLLFILTIFFQWMALGASAWLPVAMASQSPRPFYRWGLAAAGTVLIWIIINLHLAFVSFAGGTSIHYFIAASPLTTVALVCLWGFPLAACLWHQKNEQITSVSSWVFLDGLSRPINLPRQPLLKPDLALTIGLASGIVGSLFLFILLPGSQVIGLGAFSFLLVVSICVQVIAAAIATICVRDMNHLTGLFAAFVTGCILAIWAVCTRLIGGVMGVKDVPFVVLMILNTGGLFALPTVLIVSTLAGLLRRTWQKLAVGRYAD